MKIIDIKESGANNTLMWALSNGANIKEDVPLTSLINDETFYLVTLSDVNFFELFRLTQMYRDKLRIVSEIPATIPSAKDLKDTFPGEYQNDGEEAISLSEVAEHVITNFINLTAQMSNDDDIIHPGAIRMFLPMITRKFNVQIPIAFIDLIDSMSVDEAAKLFTHDYPGTLREIIDTDLHGVKVNLSLGFVKATRILKYDTRYDKYLQLTKYTPIKSYQDQTKLYKFGLLGFAKKDNISRGEVRCSLFKANPEFVVDNMKRLARLATPLELDFAIQLPIQYMQILENSFSNDVLTIQYESSMSAIIDGGLVYEDFKMFDEPIDHDSDEDTEKFEARNNAIEAYRVRITEANQVLLNTIPILAQSKSDVDTTSIFAMMPSIYTAKALIRVNMDNIQKYVGHSDPLISAMFHEIQDIANTLAEDIRNTK